MPRLLHDLLTGSQEASTDNTALRCSNVSLSYPELTRLVFSVAGGLEELGVTKLSRVAILLPNCVELVVCAFATSLAGGIFVPINPLQRARQVKHILEDSGASVLLTTRYLYRSLQEPIGSCANLRSIIFSDDEGDDISRTAEMNQTPWSDLQDYSHLQSSKKTEQNDPVAILYTSGSSGPAKGVVVSQRNIVSGAKIVSGYLENSSSDRILAALPLSFDYGFNQVTTGFLSRAEVILTNYSLPQTLLSQASAYRITGLAGVPTMWAQLSTVNWPDAVVSGLRYITNSGGRLPLPILERLRAKLPRSNVVLMYGLTEAFRSTYLDPSEIEKRPTSIGKAIPKVNLSIVREDGSLCRPGEKGELVHSGELVSLGYWGDPSATAHRFRRFDSDTIDSQSDGRSVWTGDIVEADKDGFLYFVGRRDAMIKASGYRVSPDEIEDVVFSTKLVRQVVALGIDDEVLGQKVALAIVPMTADSDIDFAIRHICARELPPYMQPGEIRFFTEFPTTPNAKPDRQELRSMFTSGMS